MKDIFSKKLTVNLTEDQNRDVHIENFSRIFLKIRFLVAKNGEKVVKFSILDFW